MVLTFENIMGTFEKQVKEKFNKGEVYSVGEIDYIKGQYEDSEGDLLAVIKHLRKESVRCLSGGSVDIYNSEQLFISIYEKLLLKCAKTT